MNICGLDFPEENFVKHVLKRKKEGLIKTTEEYIEKIKETIRNADKFYLVRQLQDCIDKVVLFSSKTKMGFDTYLIEDCKNSSYREVVKSENSKYSRFIKALQDRC